MKKNYIYNKVIVKVFTYLLPLTSCLFMSCSDFLDILPMNSTVLENYWKQKSDVASVMNACYESLESDDALTRMMVWVWVPSVWVCWVTLLAVRSSSTT